VIQVRALLITPAGAAGRGVTWGQALPWRALLLYTIAVVVASMQACILKMCSVLSLGGVVDILQSGRQPWQRLNTCRAKRTPSPGLPPEAKSVGRNARVTMLLGRHVAYGQRRNCGGAHWVLRPPQLPLSESLRR
jgi:hypothetical protein